MLFQIIVIFASVLSDGICSLLIVMLNLCVPCINSAV